MWRHTPAIIAAGSSLQTIAQRMRNAEAASFRDSVVATAPMRVPIANRSDFFFRGTNHCRLCGVHCDDPPQHFVTGVEARYHTIREVLVDLMVPYVMAGVEVEDVVQAWPDRLAARRASPAGGGTMPNAFHQNYRNLLSRAHHARQCLECVSQAGLLADALSPAMRSFGAAGGPQTTKRSRNVVEFERLEYVGDSLWGAGTLQRIAALFPGKDWVGKGTAWAFGIFRDNIESNDTLTTVFDVLGLGSMLPAGVVLTGDKPKADIMEAILGALRCALWKLQPTPGFAVSAARVPTVGCSVASAGGLSALLEHTIEEVIDLTVLVFMHGLIPQIVPLVRELAVLGLTAASVPPLSFAKGPRPAWLASRRLRSARGAWSFATFSLHETPTSASDGIGAAPVPVPLRALRPPLHAHAATDVLDLVHRLVDLPFRGLTQGVIPRLQPGPARRIAETKRRKVLPAPSAAGLAKSQWNGTLRLKSTHERMLERMHPVNAPFRINSGYIPAVVRNAEKPRFSVSRNEASLTSGGDAEGSSTARQGGRKIRRRRQ